MRRNYIKKIKTTFGLEQLKFLNAEETPVIMCLAISLLWIMLCQSKACNLIIVEMF